MPAYSYRVRKPEPAPAPAPLTIERKVSRVSTTKLTKVSRPSAAKTTENIPRRSPPRVSSDE